MSAGSSTTAVLSAAAPAAPPTDAHAAASSGETPALPIEPLLTTHRVFEAHDKEKQSLGLLHEDLFDSRPAVALSALAAVETLADTRSFPYVARLMTGAKEELQCACVRALGGIRHPEVPRLLRDLARTARTDRLRREILAALAAAAGGDKDVAAMIRQAVRTPMGSAGGRACAARLLLKVGGEAALEELLVDAREEVLDQIIASAAEEPLLLARTLRHCAPLFPRLAARNRATVATMAGSQPLKESRGILRAALGDPNAEVRRAAYAALGTEPHQAAWFSEVISQMAHVVESNPALEDEAQAAIARMARVPDARAAVSPEVRGAVMTQAADLYRQLTAVGRRVASDTHELGWLITRSKEYLEYYAEEELKSALLRYLKGTSTDTPDSLMKMLKASAVRVEVRHFDGYSALADLIKNPKRSGIALVTRELSLAHLGKARILWQLGRVIRLSTIFLSPGPGGTPGPDAPLLKTIYTWSRQEKLFRLAEAAQAALARVDISGAEASCKECLALPLPSKVLAIGSLHLLREINPELLQPAATRLLASQDDPYVTLNALEVIAAGPPLSNGELARALLTRFSMDCPREVRDELVSVIGEKLSVDVTENLKELAVSGDDLRRASALAALDRRISSGLVGSRDGTVEFLYRILRGQHEPSRRSAAIMLWKMGDDYASEVLRDFLSSREDATVQDILRRISGHLGESLLSALAPLFRRDSAAVHGALREAILQVKEEGPRRRILAIAMEAHGGGAAEEEADPFVEAAPAAVEVRSERSTFQFERENMVELVMFFTDIQGYSKKAQSLSPMQLAALLQDYEKILLSHVEAHGGELVKRMGDGHMIVFPEPLPAVLAAIRLQKSLRRFNRYRDETNRVIIRIGIHSGKVVRKASGDVLGNAVNIASRLETSSRPGSVLVSDRVQDKVKDFVHAREIGHITVKNISEPVRVFEPYEIVLDLPAELDPLRQEPGAAGRRAASAPGAAVPGGVRMDLDVYSEIVRCFSALDQVCRKAPSGQVAVSTLREQVLARWAKLRPRLPGSTAAPRGS